MVEYRRRAPGRSGTWWVAGALLAVLVVGAVIGVLVFGGSWIRRAPKAGAPKAADTRTSGRRTPPATVTVEVALTDVPIVARERKGLLVSGHVTGTVPPTGSVDIEAALGRDPGDVTWEALATGTMLPRQGGSSFTATITPSRGWSLVRAVVRSREATLGTSRAVRTHIVGDRVVALTFDDGPSLPATEIVLKALEEAGVNATFFESALLADKHKAVTRKVSRAGNVVGSHGKKHTKLTTLSGAKLANEIAVGRDTIDKLIKITPKWYRPPFGETDPESLKAIRAAGMRSVMWTVESADYRRITTAEIVENVLEGVGTRDGKIVIMHDSGMLKETTPPAVPKIIAGLKRRGFDFVTMDELDVLGGFIPEVMGERPGDR